MKRAPGFLTFLTLNLTKSLNLIVLSKCTYHFILSFIVLRRKPTSLKTFCASVIVVAEFVSLVPAIFHLGSENYSHEEGGAKGTEAAVWTILFVVAMVRNHELYHIVKRLYKTTKSRKKYRLKFSRIVPLLKDSSIDS